MTEFTYKSRKEQKEMSMRELGDYHCQKRKYEYKEKLPLRGLKIRRIIHPIIIGTLKADRILSHEKINVLSSPPKPILYACTHVGGSDVERIVETLGKPSYIFFGDPAPMYKDTPVHILIIMKGSIEFETSDKMDRHIAYERAKEHLKSGGNLIIFPEGAWNVFEQLPVMKLYTGTARMAIESPADIIPLAIEQYDKEFVIKIGQKIVVNENMDPKMLTNKLRDELATLKYDIWESQPTVHAEPSKGYKVWENCSVYDRLRLQKEHSEIFRNSIIKRRSEYGVLQEVYDTMYNDPNDINADELIANVQVRLSLLKEIDYELQQINELSEKLRNVIEQFKNSPKNTLDNIDYIIEAQKLVTLLKEKIKRIKEILKYLNTERKKELNKKDSNLEEFDFSNPYYKKEKDLQCQIDYLKQIRTTLLTQMGISFDIPSEQNGEKRISLN